jgi:hypothetical protein
VVVVVVLLVVVVVVVFIVDIVVGTAVVVVDLALLELLELLGAGPVPEGQVPVKVELKAPNRMLE